MILRTRHVLLPVLPILLAIPPIVAGTALGAASSWDDWHPIQNITAYGSVYDIEVGSNATLFTTGDGPSFPVIMWDLANQTHRDLPIVPFVTSAAARLSMRPGAQLAYDHWDIDDAHWLAVVDVESSEIVAQVSIETNDVEALEWANETVVLVAFWTGRVVAYDVVTESSTLVRSFDERIEFMAVSPDGRFAAVGTKLGRVVVWSLSTGQDVYSKVDTGKSFIDGSFSEATTEFVFVQSNRTLVWVSLSSGSVAGMRTYGQWLSSVRHLDADGALLVGALTGPYLSIMDGASGEPLWEASGVPFEVNSVAVSRDGSWVASASNDRGTVTVWAARDDPWSPPPAPPEPIPLVSILHPVDGQEGAPSRADGSVLPTGVAVAVLWTLDGSSPRSVTSGVDDWHIDLSRMAYDGGNHTLSVWAVSYTQVGPRATVTFSTGNGTNNSEWVDVEIGFPHAFQEVTQLVFATGTVNSSGPDPLVSVRVDNGSWVSAWVSNRSWFAEIHEGELQPGNHTIQAVAVVSGYATSTAMVPFFVLDVPPADTPPPAVSFTAPEPGAVIAGGFRVNGTTTDATGVGLTRIWVEGKSWFTVVAGMNWSVQVPDLWRPGDTVLVWAEATDARGFRGNSSILLELDDAAVAAVIAILRPYDGQAVGHELVIGGTCQNCKEEGRIDISVDGVYLASLPVAPNWQTSINVPPNVWGSVMLEARFVHPDYPPASANVSTVVEGDSDPLGTGLGFESVILVILVAAASAMVALALVRRRRAGE